MVLRLPSCHLNLLSSLFELMRLDLLFFINKHGHKTLKCYSKQHRPKSRETFFFFLESTKCHAVNFSCIFRNLPQLQLTLKHNRNGVKCYTN